MRPWFAVMIAVGGFAALSFAQPPQEARGGGRLLDMLRPGARVQVTDFGDRDPVGIQVVVLTDREWKEIASGEAGRREKFAALDAEAKTLEEEVEAAPATARSREEVDRRRELSSRLGQLRSERQALTSHLPESFETVREVGSDYFATETDSGVSYHAADRLRRIQQRKLVGGAAPAK